MTASVSCRAPGLARLLWPTCLEEHERYIFKLSFHSWSLGCIVFLVEVGFSYASALIVWAWPGLVVSQILCCCRRRTSNGKYYSMAWPSAPELNLCPSFHVRFLLIHGWKKGEKDEQQLATRRKNKKKNKIKNF